MREMSAQMKAIAAVVREHVAKAFGGLSVRLDSVEAQIKNLPVPKDGTSVTIDDVRPLVDEAVKAIPAPENGKDADPDIIRQMVNEAVAALPEPKDGKSVTVDDVRPVIEALVRDAIAQIPAPKDGKSVTAEEVFALVEPKMAEWALDFERRAQEVFRRAIANIPKPADGKDGLGFDDMQVLYDGERALTIKFERGDEVKEFAFTVPAQIDRGVHKAKEAYQAGDGVTWGGSYWIAQKDSPVGRPGEPGSDGWRLAVKRGRDGRDGRNGIDRTAPVKLEPRE